MGKHEFLKPRKEGEESDEPSLGEIVEAANSIPEMGDIRDGNWRRATVEGWKNQVESAQSQIKKNLSELSSSLEAAEKFAELPVEEQKKVPLEERPLRVEFARELIRSLESASEIYNSELKKVNEALLNHQIDDIKEGVKD